MVDGMNSGAEITLLMQARAGDAEAFGDLAMMHQARLRAWVARHVADPADVADIVQDAVVDAWRGLHGFQPDRPLGPWLQTIVRNRCWRFLRERARRGSQEEHLVEALIAGDDEEEQGLPQLRALRTCLEALDAEKRRLLELRYGRGEAVQAIANNLGKAPGALSMMLLRIKAALANCIERRLEQVG
jgi:RNA polymerase sigma-70 factor (ECF subfamily)